MLQHRPRKNPKIVYIDFRAWPLLSPISVSSSDGMGQGGGYVVDDTDNFEYK